MPVLPPDRFPQCLRSMRASPKVLHVEGTLRVERAVAIEGARRALYTSMEIAKAMARHCAQQGRTVVSGGAIGIDSAAHRGALDAGGATVAVLGSGLDELYPRRNQAMFAEIAQRGALVSPFERDAPPLPRHFVYRNKIIAALSTHVIVVEASARSGALYTARAARTMGRRVCAVPGSAGCDWLLSTGAVPVSQADSLDRVFEGTSPAPTLSARAWSQAELAVLAAVHKGGDSATLSETLELAPRVVMRLVEKLKMDGALAGDISAGLRLLPLAQSALAGQHPRGDKP